MPTIKSFSTPAKIQDLAVEPAAQDQLNELWSIYVEGFTRQAILGDPWNSVGNAYQNYYYNALETDIPIPTTDRAVIWTAFPNRMNQYLGKNAAPLNPNNLTQEQLWELADTGYYTDSSGNKAEFPQIPVNFCPQPDWSGTLQKYGPYGPRGWQDEYCEWSVTRNEQGKITRVDFVCENPEYWNTLWQVSPETVAQIYQDTLNYGLPSDSPKITVTVEDLQLVDQNGKVVIDPSTQRPGYNPFNKWNTGPVSQRGENPSGGVMHLTSTPNTLQTEMGLAGAATVQRLIGNSDPQALICCSQYGQAFRHSDPHIGQSVNQVVSNQLQVSLADPVGLYIQMPDFSVFQLPEDPNLPQDAKVEDCWQIVRGVETLINPFSAQDPGDQQPFNGNFILHAVFQIPESWIEAGVEFTVGDIQINYNGEISPINWAAQITETFHVGLFAYGIPAEQAAPALNCIKSNAPDESLPQPIQMMFLDLWGNYYNTPVNNPVGYPMNMASNTVIMPPVLKQGNSYQLALIFIASSGSESELPLVSVPEEDIRFSSSEVANVTYAAPGNSYPSVFQIVILDANVSPDATPGLRNIILSYENAKSDVPAPAYLCVSAG